MTNRSKSESSRGHRGTLAVLGSLCLLPLLVWLLSAISSRGATDGRIEVYGEVAIANGQPLGTGQIQFTPATSLGIVYRGQWDVDLEGEKKGGR